MSKRKQYQLNYGKCAPTESTTSDEDMNYPSGGKFLVGQKVIYGYDYKKGAFGVSKTAYSDRITDIWRIEEDDGSYFFKYELAHHGLYPEDELELEEDANDIIKRLVSGT